MTLVRLQSTSKLLVFSLCIGLFAFTSCGSSDDDNNNVSESCPFSILDGSVNIDNSDFPLSTATLSVSSSNSIFLFSIGALIGDCEELRTFTVSVNVPDGEGVTGIYDFEDNMDGASGGINIFDVDTSDITMLRFESGTVMITENAENNFTVDIDAVSEVGDAVSVNVTYQF